MNEAIFFFFYNLAHQSKILDYTIVFFALYFPYLVIILAILFLLFHHEVIGAEEPYRVFFEKKKEILRAFFAGALAWILAHAFKFFFHMSRPFDLLGSVDALFPKSDYSFPSGHATFFFALAFSIFFLHKKAGYFFLASAFIISVARIAAGVHFPVDILGGLALGALVAYSVKNV